jgi:cyanobactin maturation PatA/PatG family protease
MADATVRPPSSSTEQSLGSEHELTAASLNSSQRSNATCRCGCNSTAAAQSVYPLGKLSYDLGSEARRNSLSQHIRGNPDDPERLLEYLSKNPWEAAAIIWTLNLDATPVYAVYPDGAFAAHVYERLRQFLREQLAEGVERVERVSVPGWIVGTVKLFSGLTVPVIHPVMRGMYSWTTRALVEAVCDKGPATNSQESKQAYAQKTQAVEGFFKRIYHELRNPGMESSQRAMNYAATDALLVSKVFEDAIKEEMALDSIQVERSPICRPDFDCWDVKLMFFDPKKVLERARKVYRITINVSDVVPVMLDEVRSWYVR